MLREHHGELWQDLETPASNNEPEAIKPLDDGTNLWDPAIGKASDIHCPMESLLEELKYEGGLCGARLKVLAEIQAILRATSADVEPDKMLQIPAWHLLLLTRMAMERLS